MVVKTVNEMKGLFSGQSFSSKDVVYIPKGKIISRPTRESIQIDTNKHIDVMDEGKYINHSCNPNCEVQNGKLIAIKNIKEGDEITFNYNHSEDELSHPFTCLCCGKIIRGAKYVTEKV